MATSASARQHSRKHTRMMQTHDTDGGGPDNGFSKHADEDEVGKAHEERDEKRRNQQQVRLIELRRQLCTHPSGASWTRFRRAHVRVKPACKHQCARADSGIKPTKTRHRPARTYEPKPLSKPAVAPAAAKDARRFGSRKVTQYQRQVDK